MTVNVRLVPQFAKVAGRNEFELDLPHGAKFPDLCASIVSCYPALAPAIEESSFIVNDSSHAYDDTVLSDGDRLYMIVRIVGG